MHCHDSGHDVAIVSYNQGITYSLVYSVNCFFTLVELPQPDMKECYYIKMQANVHLVKSFTQNPELGSPTGVVLDFDGNLVDTHMQQIATKLNFAESVFVSPAEADDADYHLRFFAPKGEVDLCGHATIAAFHTLREQGEIQMNDTSDSVALVQETRAGKLAVTCYSDGMVVMNQKAPEFGAIEGDRERVAQMLGFSLLIGDSETIFVDELPLQIVSTGTPKLLIPLLDTQALHMIAPDLQEIKIYCEETGARGVYPFATNELGQPADFYARQFNPLADENEDPITGVAAGALGAYASKYALLGGKRKFIVAQGYNLGMGGDMFVDASDGVRVGGYAVSYGKTRIALDADN